MYTYTHTHTHIHTTHTPVFLGKVLMNTCTYLVYSTQYLSWFVHPLFPSPISLIPVASSPGVSSVASIIVKLIQFHWSQAHWRPRQTSQVNICRKKESSVEELRGRMQGLSLCVLEFVCSSTQSWLQFPVSKTRLRNRQWICGMGPWFIHTVCKCVNGAEWEEGRLRRELRGGGVNGTSCICSCVISVCVDLYALLRASGSKPIVQRRPRPECYAPQIDTIYKKDPLQVGSKIMIVIIILNFDRISKVGRAMVECKLSFFLWVWTSNTIS